MVRYKYIHFLWGYDTKFSGPLVNMINNTPQFFKVEEHLFITPFESVKNAFSSYNNVILDSKGSASHLINKYGDSCDWIISHGLIGTFDTLRIKRRLFKNIIWRTWGASRQKSSFKWSNPLKSLYNWCCDYLYFIYMRLTFDKSPVFGISNVIDVIDVEQWGWNKKTKLLVFGYPTAGIDEIVKRVEERIEKKDSLIRVLVGHQGDPNEHHVDFVRQLLSYHSDKLLIYLPLSYGNRDYIKEAIEELKGFKDNNHLVILDSLMPKKDYIKFLGDIDIAIFDGKTSMALGNIAYLLRFKKKLYLNPDGIIRKAFDKEGIPYGTTKEINTLDFDDFISPLHYPKTLVSDISYQTYQDGINHWLELFTYLESING